MTLPAHAAEPAEPEPAALAPIMAALHAVRHVSARYVERRTLHMLRSPIETRGTLRFDAPDRLEKTADPGPDGAADHLLIEHGRVSVENGAGTTGFALDAHPEIGVLVDSIRATLAGDAAALTRGFTFTLAGDAARWQMVLQPRAHRDLLHWLRVSGTGGQVDEIDTEDGEGDYSAMTIVPIVAAP